MHGSKLVVLGIGASLVLAVLPVLGIASAARTPEQVYDGVCKACHDSGVAPVILGKHLEVKYIKDTVRNGGLQMPPVSAGAVSDEELDALAQWVSSHQ